MGVVEVGWGSCSLTRGPFTRLGRQNGREPPAPSPLSTTPPQTHCPLSSPLLSSMAGRSPVPSGRRRWRGRGWSKTPMSLTSLSTALSTVVCAEPPLLPGTEVEVRVDDDGFHGSWFEATVEGFVPWRAPRTPARYTVSYKHLLADDSASILIERFAPTHVRPRPPPRSQEEPLALGMHDIVEAFHNDGWWSGIVLVVGDPDVTVAFPITREVIAFSPSLVRPRRDYVDGLWVPSEVAIVVHPKHAVRVYEVGDKVEVVRDRKVYGYSWFSATVVKVIDKMSYLVEYSDLEGEGEVGGKAAEYLHWRFIRPAVEHSPRESEFQLGSGAAVEAYCDGAWSPGVVRRVIGEGEYEVSVDGKEGEVLVTKVPELLKAQYKWNGKSWRIVSAKRHHLRQQSISGKSPSSPVDVFSSDDECRHDTKSSAMKRSRKRSRKEVEQLEVMLTEDSEHASCLEMNTPLSELCKSSENNHSLKSCSKLSGMENFQVVSKKIASDLLVQTNGILDASSGHSILQNASGENDSGNTVVNQEILSEMMVSTGQINTPIFGTSVDEGCATISTARFRKQKVAFSHGYNVTQQREGMPLSVEQPQMKKVTPLKLKMGEMRSIQAIQGRNDRSEDSKRNRSMEIICALGASTQSSLSPMGKQRKAFDAVSRQAGSGSNTTVFISKKLAKKKSFKELNSPHNSLDSSSTVKLIGRKKGAAKLKGSSVKRQLEGETHTKQHLNKALEDALNTNKVISQQLLPLTPPGFEKIVNRKRSCDRRADGLSETNIHSSLSDEGLNVTINRIYQENHNVDAQTGNVATQTCEINRLMEKPFLSIDVSVEKDGGKAGEGPIQSHLWNNGSLQCSTDNAILMSCSFGGSSMASDMPMCQFSSQQVPFVKSSPVWSLIEAMDVFQKVPQRPHFLPLKQISPALCEGVALGLMVSYASLVESIRKLRITDSMASFNENVNTLAYLEKNGFSVQSLLHSLTKLHQIKSDYTNSLGDRKKLKEHILDKASAVSRIDALLDEKDNAIFKLEQELGRLRCEALKIARNKEDESAELSRLKAEDSHAEEACGQAEQQFSSVLSELQ
ncbi:hypothetical protein GUJ93_ZPchr0011g27217 [Zizania palustris]|uniref:Agenet domain-containing protein n=1 Tax=Zizania palustris TaxID=103762 RepID=A0A8J5WHJ6_ZIZPA|nr:hypothetical protein GUJ93_ZPchr0011g27217 [Zizania palustris]